MEPKETTRSGRQPRSRRALALLTCAVVVLAACGSRRTDDELLAAARGNAPGTAGRPASAATGPATNQGGAVTGTGTQSATTGTGSGTAGTGAGGGAGGDGGGAGGGSAGSGGTGGGQVGAAQCSGPADEIAIGTVGEQSGIFGPFLAPIVQAIQAWAASVNDQGGVNCHKIRYIVKDDGGDPSVHQSLVQELVEQDHVVAMVGMDAPIAGNASVSYLTQKGIPVVGSEGGSDWFYGSPVYFPQMTNGNTALGALVKAIGDVGKPQGKQTLGVLTCLEAALCSALYGSAPELAQQAGLNLAYRTQASLTQPDFTSVCQSAQGKGVNLFIAGLDTNSIQRLLRNCSSIGFNPLYITGGPLVTPSLMEDPRAEGFYVSSATELYTATRNPEVASFLDVLATYAPGLSPSISAMAGWTAAKLFEKALSTAAEATPAVLLAALGSIQGDDLGGITQPLTFTAGQPAPRVTCIWIGQVQGGTLGVPSPELAGRRCA